MVSIVVIDLLVIVNSVIDSSLGFSVNLLCMVGMCMFYDVYIMLVMKNSVIDVVCVCWWVGSDSM